MNILENILKQIFNFYDKVICYDYTDIHNFHHILQEEYNIDSVDNNKFELFNDLKSELKKNNYIFNSLEDITNILLNLCSQNKININNFIPSIINNKTVSSIINTYKWKIDNNDNKNENVLNLQKLYSIRKTTSNDNIKINRKDFWDRNQLKNRWGDIKINILNKYLNKDSHILAVGPRYDNEILFFRNTLGFKNTIGLDLFTNDSNLTVKGDMNNIPFDDNSFDCYY